MQRPPAIAVIQRPKLPFELAGTGLQYSILCEGEVLARFEYGSTVVTFGEAAMSRFAPFDVLRWAAPFVLVPLGCVFLHAAGCARDGAALAFLGRSGAGKSTTCQAMQAQGYAAVADDALLCTGNHRVNGSHEATLRTWCHAHGAAAAANGEVDFRSLADRMAEVRLADGGRDPLLAAILILQSPRDPGTNAVLRKLGAAEAFDALTQYSFGSAPNAEAWWQEAQAYAALARDVPVWQVRMPDGLKRLQEALPAMIKRLGLAAVAVAGAGGG